MAGKFPSQRKVAIVGFGQSEVARRSTRSLASLTVEACDKALEDSGVTRRQINGLSTFPTMPGGGDNKTSIDGQDFVTTSYLADVLGLDTVWKNDYQGGGQVGGSVIHAANALAAGACDYVLLHRALHNPPGRYHAFGGSVARGAAQWTVPYGHSGAPQAMAFVYNEYMERYGATRREMATLAVQIRQNVQNNPMAFWDGTPLTVDDYMNTRMIAEPMSLLDCDIPVDCAAAFVLTTAERARDLKHKPVYIVGYGLSHSPGAFGAGLDVMAEGGARLGKYLWGQTGLTPKDIDCPQIYDGFTPLVYIWMEALGFCPVGEAHRFIQNGTIDPKGKFPLLSGGGNQGNGRIHGVPHIRENYLQLSGRAGERQIPNCEIGLSCHSMPHFGSTLVYTNLPSL